MDQPPRPRATGILTRAMLMRAWLWLGMLEAALVTGGFLFVLLRAEWSPGDPTGQARRCTTRPLQPLLLWGIAFELAFAAAVIYAAPLQGVSRTVALGLPELALLAPFPVIVWGSDELRRAWLRCRERTSAGSVLSPPVCADQPMAARQRERIIDAIELRQRDPT